MAEAGNTYSFIDIAAWDGVRENFLSGHPIAVFSRDFETLLWVNGRAAQLFGFSSIGEFEAAGPDGMGTALRQLRSAATRAGADEPVRTLLRIASGMTSKLLNADVRRIRGRDGTSCIMVSIDSGKEDETERDFALAAISGLATEGAGAAIVDADGNIIAADPLFSGLSVPEGALSRLVRDVRDEDDRLVKRLVTPKPAMPVAVAIARLTDSPARHLVMAVKASEGAEEAEPVPAEEPDVAQWDELVEEEVPTALVEQKAPVAAGTAETPDAALSRLEPTAQATPFEPDFEAVRGPVRFVWKTSSDGHFTDISPEFASAVGPNAADIVGRTFEEVARVFELDPSGEISASLHRHDTWSGKSVLWPVQGTAFRVPVDLAALPSYNRDRDFEGYRGFGIVRMSERKLDSEKLGLALAASKITAAAGEAKPVQVKTEEPAIPETAEPDRQTLETPEPEASSGDPFAGEVPALEPIAPQPMRRESDKIIDLQSKRRSHTAGEALNPSEQAAFRQIGDVLGWARAKSGEDADAEKPGAEESAAPADETEVAKPETAGDDFIAAYEGDARPGEQPETATPEEAVEPAGEVAQAIREPEAGTEESGAGKEATGEAETAEDADAGEAEEAHGYMPSAFAPGHGADDEENLGGLTPSFLDGLPLPVLIHRDDVALYANQAFAEMTGYPTTEELNEAGGIDKLFKGETVGEGMVCLLAADGETVTVRAHMQAVPWHGRTALMFAFEPQEEQQVQAAAAEPGEAELSEAAELRAILDTATDGVVVLSSDGVIRSLNASASALFGYSDAEVEGKSFSVLFAQESQSAALDYLHGLAHNGVASVLNEGLEVLGREKNGGFLPLFMTIGRLETSHGFCAVVRDITAWKQTEQALRDAQRNAESASSHKTEFLAKISHEIRTPLNAIIGFSELMAEERFGPIGNERYKSYLADINKSGKYVLDLVNDLLDISKIEAGKQELEFESVSLNEAVSEAVSMIQPQANRSRIIIRSSLDEELPDVVADARSLKQIVLNVLSNSVRFTHSGGQVIINTTYNARGEVVLRIKDTGIGMSAKEIETALQPFQQVASLGRARGDGTGLGLPLTKALVEANRAEFAIQSEPGRGTAVEIVFPPSRVLAS
jgi:PAS domain S-box-containing protein